MAYVTTNATYPNIWSEIDGLGKSLYSVVLTDLGQDTPTILTSTAALHYYTRNFKNVTEKIVPSGHVPPGPAQDSFSQIGDASRIHFSEAFVTAKYLCQVPRLNSTGSVIMTVLLANLVLMGTTWTLVNFGAASYVRRSDPSGTGPIFEILSFRVLLLDVLKQ
jgi:hypothetical protein